MAQRFAAIRAEFDAAEKKAPAEAEKGETEFEGWKIYGADARPGGFLAADGRPGRDRPQGPAARDVLLWVIDKPGMGPRAVW